MKKTINILNNIDILKFIPDKNPNFNISILMDTLNTYVNSIDKEKLNNEYFSGDLFNNMNEDEFIEYLYNRYNDKICILTYEIKNIYKC